jgi:hypothetical protein
MHVTSPDKGNPDTDTSRDYVYTEWQASSISTKSSSRHWPSKPRETLEVKAARGRVQPSRDPL